MEFQEVVRKRRMVRHFKNIEVPKEKIDIILQLAQHAPSAGFSQGVAYVVVMDKYTKKKLQSFRERKNTQGQDFTDGLAKLLLRWSHA